MYSSIKFWGLALIMLLALYPIVELTRVILVSGEYYFPEMGGQFGAEITIMWAMYLSIIPVFLLINTHRVRSYQKKKRELLKRNGLERNNISLPK